MTAMNSLAVEQRESLVVIGNGMAGMRTVEELLKLSPEMYDITVFGTENHGNYNRIMLSPVLAAQQSFDDIIIHNDAWYREHSIELHKGTTVTAIDREQQLVIDSNGKHTPYDKLLIATGSNPFIIPVPGHDADGVISYRDINDVNKMIEYAEHKQHAVVIGGGLLGLEAAYGLLQRGMKVSVVHIMPILMERQLDQVAASMLRATLEAEGLTFLMEHSTEAITCDDNGHVNGLTFTNGVKIPADLVVMAVGIKPNIALGSDAGLNAERALVVDDNLITSDPNIFAVGECVQHRGMNYGLVAPLYDQAKVCANHLAKVSSLSYEGSQLMTKLKVTGINLFSAGDFLGDDTSEAIVYEDKSAQVYKKLVIQNNRLIGAVMYGDTQDGSWYFDLINQASDISAMRADLIFGQTFTAAADA